MKKYKLKKRTLIKLYIDEQKTIRVVAQIVKRSESTVLRYLRNYGIPTRAKAAHLKGIPRTDEVKEKLRNANLGKKASKATLKKMSEIRKGKKQSGRTRRRIFNGYVHLYIPEHPMSPKNGYLYEHRKIMSEKLGRNLTKKEIVHHINGKRDDNRPENLALTTRVSHSDFHKGKVKCPYCKRTYIVKSIGR